MGKFSQEMAKSLEGELSKALNTTMQKAYQGLITEYEEQLDDFCLRMREKIDALYEYVPVKHICINEAPEEIDVGGHVSPFLEQILSNASLGIMTLMVGPAGCGKTTTAEQVAKALKLQFGTICFTAGASETWLFGRQTPNGFVEGIFSKLYREGGVFLADEMDAADANLMLSINTALSHDCMLNPMSGELNKKHKDFIFIGAANTKGKGATHVYTGRSRLDAATLDRFSVVFVSYDETLERSICPDALMHQTLWSIRRELADQECEEFVSTRAFVFAQKKLKAGVARTKIVEQLMAPWGEAAKDLARKIIVETAEIEDKQRRAGQLKKKASEKRKVAQQAEMPF